RQTFTCQSAALSAGERMVIYSDGLEPVLMTPAAVGKPPEICLEVADVLRAQPAAFVDRIVDRLDTRPGGLMDADDASMILIDIVPSDANVATDDQRTPEPGA